MKFSSDSVINLSSKFLGKLPGVHSQRCVLPGFFRECLLGALVPPAPMSARCLGTPCLMRWVIPMPWRRVRIRCQRHSQQSYRLRLGSSCSSSCAHPCSCRLRPTVSAFHLAGIRFGRRQLPSRRHRRRSGMLETYDVGLPHNKPHAAPCTSTPASTTTTTTTTTAHTHAHAHRRTDACIHWGAYPPSLPYLGFVACVAVRPANQEEPMRVSVHTRTHRHPPICTALNTHHPQLA